MVQYWPDPMTWLHNTLNCSLFCRLDVQHTTTIATHPRLLLLANLLSSNLRCTITLTILLPQRFVHAHHDLLFSCLLPLPLVGFVLLVGLVFLVLLVFLF